MKSELNVCVEDVELLPRQGEQDAVEDTGNQVDSPYARYVLMVLVLVYICNVIDRQIISILAEDIKADLQLTDADMGFLGGAAFAVFFAVFGIPLGKLADVWNRTRLISIGLGFWSLMTALSGLAKGFGSLAFCRFGVGIGEATASPSSYSIMYDYFSPKVRTTVVSVYAAGIYVGSGLGLYLGGMVLDSWNTAFSDPTLAPLGLKGWQAAFLIVGIPGVLMAFWVATLKEPLRGLADGVRTVAEPHPFKEAFLSLVSLLPVTNLWLLMKDGGGVRHIMINAFTAALTGGGAWGLVYLTGDFLQWVTLGVGVYVSLSWIQSLALRDPVAFGLIFKCKALLFTIGSFVGSTFMAMGVGFWGVPYLQRTFDVSPAEVGTTLGMGFVVMGLPGVLLGGLLADKLRTFTSRGKLYVQLCSGVLSALAILVFLTADDLTTAYTGMYISYFVGAMGFGPGASTSADLVIPRVRATISAFTIMVVTLGAYAIGPYAVGALSDAFTQAGASSSEALRQAMLWGMITAIAAMCCTLMAIRHIETDEKSLRERARALGEKI